LGASTALVDENDFPNKDMLASGVWRFLYYWLWRGEPLAGVPLKNPAESVWRHEFETRTSPNGV